MLVHSGSPRALGVSGFIACRWSTDSAGRLACHWEAEGPNDPKPSRRLQASEGIHKTGEGLKLGVGDHTPERFADHEPRRNANHGYGSAFEPGAMDWKTVERLNALT